MKPSIIIHYGELALKGGNRHLFEKRLLKNVQHALQHFSVRVTREYGRMLIEGKETDLLEHKDALVEILKKIFGISVFSFAYRVQGGYAEIEQAVIELLQQHSFDSFAVRARRVNKQFPMSSEEVNRTLGAKIVQVYNKKVDLRTPMLEIRISISSDGNDISVERFQGAGGLPVGMSGNLLSLLSSGIDSPVASYRMMKRGARVIYLHFHSYPMTSRASIENVEELVALLQHSQPPSLLLLVPLLDMQKMIVKDAPPTLRILLYRRAMFQIAERIAEKYSVQALVTGESLSQVASQTVENMYATTADITLPIFRPLIGFDKQEIMDEASRIGTYDISIRPYEDCCSLLTPKTVETKARLQDLVSIQQRLNWEEMIENTIAQIEEKKV